MQNMANEFPTPFSFGEEYDPEIPPRDDPFSPLSDLVETSESETTTGGAEVQDKLKHEFFGRAFTDVEGFYEKYFPTPVDERILNSLGALDPEGWVDWPEPNSKGYSSESRRVDFLVNMQLDLLASLEKLSLPLPVFCYFDTRERATQHVNDETNRPDILMVSEVQSGFAIQKFYHVFCVGELKHRLSEENAFLKIARYARAILRHHPELRFVHSFVLENDYFTPWVFDRSGAYSGEGFSINEEKVKFVTVFYGYLRMSLRELGWEPTMEIVSLPNKAPGFKFSPVPGVTEFSLNLRPLSRQNAIVCRGTTCFKAQIIKISNVRPKKTQFTQKFNLPYDECAVKFSWVHDTASDEREIFEAARGAPYVAQLVDSGILGSTEEDHRPLRLDPHSTLEITFPESHRPPLQTFFNRTCRYIVTQPCGSRLLVNYTTPLELVSALRDVIVGHRFLYEKRGILHRDISPRNILLEAGHGWLIDMDHAVFLDRDIPQLEHKTGTRPYMAIGVLYGQRHSFRHDLESFLYVLVLLSCSGEYSPRHTWNCNNDGLYNKKLVVEDLYHGVSVRYAIRGLKQELAITPIFDLISGLYRVLFMNNYGYDEPRGPPFYGHAQDSSAMYDAVLAEFDKALPHMQDEHTDR